MDCHSFAQPMNFGRPLASRFVFDEAKQTVTIDGVRVHGEMLNHIFQSTPDGQWLRMKRDGDTMTVEVRTDLVRREDIPKPPTVAELLACARALQLGQCIVADLEDRVRAENVRALTKVAPIDHRMGAWPG